MPVLLQRTLAFFVVLTLVAFSPTPAAQGQSASPSPAVVDPASVVLRESDLPPGFAVEVGGQSRLALPDGGDKLIRTFRRDPSYGGVTMIRNTVWSYPAVGPASDVMRSLPDLLVSQGFTAVDGPQIGDETITFQSFEVANGQRVLYATLAYRLGTVVVMTTTYGAEDSTGVSDAASLAGVTYSRVGDLVATRPTAPVPSAVSTTQTGSSSDTTTAASSAAAPAYLTPEGPPGLIASGSLTDAPELGDNLRLGGFSGLTPIDRTGTLFWTITDRGPNDEIKVSGNKRMTFPMPDYSPSLVKIQLQDGQVRVQDRIPIRLPSGFRDSATGSDRVSGISNSERDEVPYNRGGKKQLTFDPYGLDTESLALDPRDGSFWVSEEYGPSILKLSPDGVIQFRLVPEGWNLDAPGERVRPILPGILLKRKANRGFEGLGLSPDGSTLFAIMQSPLSDPTESAGEASRNVRVVVLDVTGEPTVKAVYVYQTDDASQVGIDDQDQIKIGDLTALSSTRFLVLERDSVDNGPHKMVYDVDISGATSVLGRKNLGRRTLEQVPASELADAGVTPLTKRPVVNLRDYGYAPERIEGLAFVDERTIAVVNDNNFGFIGFESNGRAIPSGEPTRLVVVRLPSQLP